jgi:hypothetical protein
MEVIQHNTAEEYEKMAKELSSSTPRDAQPQQQKQLRHQKLPKEHKQEYVQNTSRAVMVKFTFLNFYIYRN